MKKRYLLGLLGSHLVAGAIGFAGGIYALPILIAPDSPSTEEVAKASGAATYQASFVRDLPGSDAFHWGEGKVFIGQEQISFEGKLAPGPDYKLYLSPTYVETEQDFLKHKDSMVRVGDIKTFENFVVPVSSDIDPSRYQAVIVWCETFSEFITAARYQ